MFDKEFYPTPPSLIEKMVEDIDLKNKTVLEPSAGKGDIVEWCKLAGSNVIACEKHPDLAKIVASKCKLLANDFFDVTEEMVSHVNYIIMNPPFSNAEKHILHAYEIAPPGCQIIAICNADTIDGYERGQRRLLRTIDDFGKWELLQNEFSQAERRTNVSIALINLYKPGVKNDDFSDFFLGEDPEEQQSNGIMPYNEVRNIVQRYVNCIKCFDEFSEIKSKMDNLASPFKVGTFNYEISYDKNVSTKEDFIKELQKKAWSHVFDKLNVQKYVTKGVMRDINSFVESQRKIPFTMKNIYKMLEIIIGTRQQTMDRSLTETIEKFTRHTDENRYAVEGWKTNEGHLLAPKFIIPYMFEPAFRGGVSPRYNGYQEDINDLVKVLCWLTGSNYNDHQSLYNFCREFPTVETNRWYSWAFFEFKAFKKGTMHIKFQNMKDWEILNRKYAEIKGQVLPEAI